MILDKKIINFINDYPSIESDPIYIYDSDKIRTQCRNFLSIEYQNKSIHFASMANVNPDFLRLIKTEGIHIFVNSLMHLKMATDLGFKGDEIIFTASGLSVNTMKVIQESGVQVNLDSPNQLLQWQSLFPGKPVGIRCNIGEKFEPASSHAGYFIGRESRLGFTAEELDDIADKSLINGLHLYIGTNLFDIDYFINCYLELIKIADDFPNIEYLNFGGGFGLAENGERSFDLPLFDRRVTELMQRTGGIQPYKMILEPGRIIGGDAGYFVSQVTDVKVRESEIWVGLNGSTVQFCRPLLYPESANHPVMVIRNGKQVSADELHPTTIFGCSTYSRDLFARRKALPAIKMGDLLVIGNAGSYSASSYMEFLGFPKPKEFFI